MKGNFSVLLHILTFSILFVGCTKENDTNDAGKLVELSNPTDGNIVVSTYSGTLTNPGTLLILDKYGNVTYSKSIPTAAVNFKKWQVNGKTRYTYVEYDAKAFKITTTGSILPGTAVVLNESFQEIKRVKLLPYNGRTSTDPNAVDSHEFIYLDDNHFITLSYFQKPVTNIPTSLHPISNCLVVAPIIQETLNDSVIFEWDGTKYPEFYQQSLEGNVFSNASVVHDYIHMNSIYVDPKDNNLICSMRHQNQVIKISRTDGHIIWRLGGVTSNFAMTPNMKFLRQHSASLVDSNHTVLLFDNGEATERPYTRVLEFRLNNAESAIDSFKTYTLPLNIFAQYMGSVLKRGDTYFIGCGSVPKILEVNYVTNKINFLMNLSNVSYRAQKN